MSVVAFHGHFGVPGGFIGVDVFFAISGFVITAALVRELEGTGRIDLRAFYERRVKRLLPALAVLLLFVAFAGSLLTPAAATHMTGMTGLFASIFAANAYLYSLPTGYFSVSTQLDPLLHTWTLAVEEQFYLAFPALLLGSWMLGARREGRGRLVASVVIGAACLDSTWLADRASSIPHLGPNFGYYAAPARAWEFAAGSLAALAVPISRRLSAQLALVLATLGVAGILLVAFRGSAQSGLLLIGVTPVAATGALLVAGSTPNVASTLLGCPPMARIGDLSYSWYLWHWPLIVFAGALFPRHPDAISVAAIASIVPAWASYRLVENPIRFNPQIRGRRVVKVAAVCIAVPAVASFVAAERPLAQLPHWTHGDHADLARGCDSDALYGATSRARCTWPVPHPRGTVVLIGDSNAGHFTEPFVLTANRAGFVATVAAPSGCPFVQLQIWRAAYDYRPCVRFNRDALRELERLRPSLVVISSRTDRYLRDPSFSFGESERTLSSASSKKERLWTADLGSEVSALNRVGVPVVLVRPIPYMPLTQGNCAVILLLAKRCGASISRQRADAQLAQAARVEQAAIQGKHAWIVSFEDQICSRGECSGTRRNMYRNQDHLSVPGALILAARFASEVIPHARPQVEGG